VLQWWMQVKRHVGFFPNLKKLAIGKKKLLHLWELFCFFA